LFFTTEANHSRKSAVPCYCYYILQCAPDFDVKVSVLSMVICRSSPSKTPLMLQRWRQVAAVVAAGAAVVAADGGMCGGGTCRSTCRRKGSLKLRQLPRAAPP
jgi:hypothetical protein